MVSTVDPLHHLQTIRCVVVSQKEEVAIDTFVRSGSRFGTVAEEEVLTWTASEF